ncbi:transporter [Tepiditoga spiralis]|uniref:Transporter n=1 Tax=Tepiditoga spiralis TaxID=2108365 RepID=A0A7G1GB28_9BACT|nr:AEC family transporter [Tepiditoga spiralis]BBE30809.1 transporter [Tepiditoga spiralis]
MNYTNILNQVSVLFLLILTGYFTRKFNLLNDEKTKTLSDIVLNLTLPALIISSMQMDFSISVLIKSGNFILLSLIVYAVIFIFSITLPKLLKSNEKEIGVYKFSIMFSNVGFMGYPVVNAVFGKKALFYTAIYNLPFNLLIFTIGIMFLSKDIRLNKKIILNPGIISVLIGFTMFLFSIKLFTPIKMTIDMIGSVTTPISMMVIGSLLAKNKLNTIFTNWRIYIITFIRLFFVPFFIWIILKNIITDPLMLGISILISSMPVAANSAILAEEYEGNAELASKVVFISTFFSIITIPIIVKLFITN